MLKERLRGRLPEWKVKFVSSSFDLVGDIAVLRILNPKVFSRDELKLVAETVFEVNRRVRTILYQAAPVKSMFRVKKLIFLAGEPKTESVHREYGCVYRLDLAKVFFTPRLSYERIRVARMVEDGEYVLNMFAGVGCFSICIAKHSGARAVYSIDLNPVAYRFMVENVKLNRVENVVIPILGEAGELVESRFRGVADRVLEPLPDLAYAYLGAALNALKPEGGWIHYYNFIHIKSRSPTDEVVRVRRRIEKSKWKLEYAAWRKVRSTGPNWVQLALDLKVSRKR